MSRSPSRSSGVGLTKQAANGTFAPLVNPALTGNPTANGQALATVYNVTHYGFVPDGTTDNAAAQAAFKTTVEAAGAGTPVLIYVPAGEYASTDTWMLPDLENVAVWLDAGAHVFTTAATSTGTALAWRGHGNLGTATTPQRTSMSILGPGKVTGWLSGSNENAIGGSRFARVLIDGPTVEAGRKGFTVQYGWTEVTVGYLNVLACGLKGIAIEQQVGAPGGRAFLRGPIHILQAQEEAVLCTASEIYQSGPIIIEEAFAGLGATTSGAVLYNGSADGPLSVCLAGKVRVKQAHTAHGLVISGATALAKIDGLYVDAAAQSAVDFFNCTGSNFADAYGGNSVPSMVTLSGTTAAVRTNGAGQSTYGDGTSGNSGLITVNTADTANTPSLIVQFGGAEQLRLLRQSGSSSPGLQVAAGKTFRFTGASASSTPLQIRTAALWGSNTSDAFSVQDNGSVTSFRIGLGGYPIIKRNAAPADTLLGNSEMTFWLTDTPGGTVFNVKAKDSGGTVRTGTIALA